MRQCFKGLDSGGQEFLFTHPGGVPLPRTISRHPPHTFQFPHPGGCDSASRGLIAVAKSFNSRTREGCDRADVHHFEHPARFQFTHPGGVRPECLQLGDSEVSVSIHAPGRGATYVYGYAYRYFKVSIHAPGRGATGGANAAVNAYMQFQFTHPGGVRPLLYRNDLGGQAFQFTHPGGVRLPRERGYR